MTHREDVLTRAIARLWPEACGPGWEDTSETEMRSETLILRAAKYVYFCPACEKHGPAEGRFVVCCGLTIEPYYITRELRLRLKALLQAEQGEIGGAMALAAGRGGTVVGGLVTELKLTAPKRVYP